MSIAPLPSTTNNPLNRADLASFLPSPRTIKAYELLQSDSSNSVGKINEVIDQSNRVEGAPVLTTSASDAFDAESVLSASQGINLSLTPGSAALTLTSTGVTVGTYGDESHLASFTVDAKGRITAATQITLISDNVAEGSINLYFTQARARASISSVAPIVYNPSNGQISLSASGVTPGTYANPTSITVDGYGRVTAIS